MVLKSIISGGQIGADQGALDFALKNGFKTGGWMPLGWRTLDGARPDFKTLYGMRTCSGWGYIDRTFLNVRDSDGTVRFARDFKTQGEKCTLQAIREFKKPYLDIHFDFFDFMAEDPPLLREWIETHSIKVLNVAGNSETTAPGVSEYVKKFLAQALL